MKYRRWLLTAAAVLLATGAAERADAGEESQSEAQLLGAAVTFADSWL